MRIGFVGPNEIFKSTIVCIIGLRDSEKDFNQSVLSLIDVSYTNSWVKG
jgi:hypothetical protein